MVARGTGGVEPWLSLLFEKGHLLEGGTVDSGENSSVSRSLAAAQDHHKNHQHYNNHYNQDRHCSCRINCLITDPLSTCRERDWFSEQGVCGVVVDIPSEELCAVRMVPVDWPSSTFTTTVLPGAPLPPLVLILYSPIML